MQVAIVTGASSGIGFGCATKLAGMGMAIVGTGRDESRLADLAEAIDDSDLRDARVADEDVLDLLGRDVLSVADDDVLGSAGDHQIPVVDPSAEISRTEESLVVE